MLEINLKLQPNFKFYSNTLGRHCLDQNPRVLKWEGNDFSFQKSIYSFLDFFLRGNSLVLVEHRQQSRWRAKCKYPSPFYLNSSPFLYCDFRRLRSGSLNCLAIRQLSFLIAISSCIFTDRFVTFGGLRVLRRSNQCFAEGYIPPPCFHCPRLAHCNFRRDEGTLANCRMVLAILILDLIQLV